MGTFKEIPAEVSNPAHVPGESDLQNQRLQANDRHCVNRNAAAAEN
jgi:hypothetical protein